MAQKKSIRALFSRPFRLSLAPTICPWVSEDEKLKDNGRISRKIPIALYVDPFNVVFGRLHFSPIVFFCLSLECSSGPNEG